MITAHFVAALLLVHFYEVPGGYITEDGAASYVAEDGTFYVQEV